ncbi:hypothetical protein, partial [Salmonella enterica]|uniref:hypothetical protein n=1 Tax=Salmonella enterica TaxID=28901 RepID=UPI003CF019D2
KTRPEGKLAWKAFDSRGEAGTASSGAAALEAAYDFPYLAHATMEPMNCVAIVKGNQARLIFGSQTQTLDQLNTARI